MKNPRDIRRPAFTEGNVYVKVRKMFNVPDGGCMFTSPSIDFFRSLIGFGGDVLYADSHPSERIISAKRVEEAVEMADLIALCKERSWLVLMDRNGEWVVRSLSEPHRIVDPSKTLRAAIFLCEQREEERAGVSLWSRLQAYTGGE